MSVNKIKLDGKIIAELEDVEIAASVFFRELDRVSKRFEGENLDTTLEFITETHFLKYIIQVGEIKCQPTD